MNKHILIISYVFPPYPGIGGRRWAKFTKYLSRKGYEIHVICAKNPGKEISTWMNDVQSENIKIYTLNIFYPKAFSFTNYSKSIANRIAFRFWALFFKLYSKGIIYDRTFFWKKPLLKKAGEIISEYKIKNVIVTIPPYRLSYHSLFLKSFSPDINLIVDYRDPWTDNKTFQGFKNLSPKRLTHEKKYELEVLQKADYVITTTEQMTAWAKEKLPANKEKCITINNGYDSEDIPHLLEEKNINRKKILLSAGNLYPHLEYILIPFVEFVRKKEKQDKSFPDKYSFEFYGNISPDYDSLFKNNFLKSVSINGFVSRKELNEKYNKVDFFLMFTVSDHSFAFNTKFCEYLAYKKPIIHFCEDGDVTQFLEKNQLGFGISPNSFEQDMNRLFNQIGNGNFNFNAAFNVEQFSVEQLTEKIEQILK